ncbi:NUDIX domain-containing protein [Reinekea forsetii]|nr:NUDIX domain-containing protein [Reinekea forsetii]
MLDRFTIHFNPFNGAEVTIEQPSIGLSDIETLLDDLRRQNKALVWVTLPIAHAHLVPLLTRAGFVFHLCNEQALTLICRLQPNAYAPFSPTHTAGVGTLVQRENGDVLLVRERIMNGVGLKLPGGYIDMGEQVLHAAEREVFEETGIQATFTDIVGFVTKYPHQHEKGNFFIVCRLKPSTFDINVQDTDEIDFACWVNPETFINDETSSRFHRHIVAHCLNTPGLKTADYEFEPYPPGDKEMFLL